MIQASLPAIPNLIILGEITADRFGAIYQGATTAEQKSVRVHVMDRHLLKDGSKDAFEKSLRQITHRSAPWMLEMISFDFDAPAPYIVTENRDAPTLLDELRNCGGYDAKEAAEILFQIYAAHVVCWNLAGLEESKSIAGLTQLFHTRDAVHGRVVVDPVALIVRGLAAGGRLSLAEGFCHLFCQLLGHHFQEFRGRYRFAPIPSLSAETNEFLRLVFQAPPEQFPDLGKIIQTLTGKSAVDLPASPAPVVIAPLVHLEAKWQGATKRLTLILPEQNRYLRIAVRDEVSLGRSSGDADMVTQFFPRSSMNDSRTFRISRRHGVIRKTGEQILFLEPDASNQSRVDGMAVGENGIALRHESKISLASEFNCQILFFPHESKELGALTVEALEKESLAFSLLWLFSEISFRVSHDGAIHGCPSDAADASGKFMLVDGIVRVAAFVDSLVMVNQVAVPANHTMPLPSEGTLQLGEKIWQIAED
jgi:hypothetical protein